MHVLSLSILKSALGLFHMAWCHMHPWYVMGSHAASVCNMRPGSSPLHLLSACFSCGCVHGVAVLAVSKVVNCRISTTDVIIYPLAKKVWEVVSQ